MVRLYIFGFIGAFKIQAKYIYIFSSASKVLKIYRIILLYSFALLRRCNILFFACRLKYKMIEKYYLRILLFLID